MAEFAVPALRDPLRGLRFTPGSAATPSPPDQLRRSPPTSGQSPPVLCRSSACCQPGLVECCSRCLALHARCHPSWDRACGRSTHDGLRRSTRRKSMPVVENSAAAPTQGSGSPHDQSAAAFEKLMGSPGPIKLGPPQQTHGQSGATPEPHGQSNATPEPTMKSGPLFIQGQHETGGAHHHIHGAPTNHSDASGGSAKQPANPDFEQTFEQTIAGAPGSAAGPGGPPSHPPAPPRDPSTMV